MRNPKEKQKKRFYRAYAISPVSIGISGFCLTKIPGLIEKAACFVHAYVCFCFCLQLRVLCLKYPFYTTSVFAYKSAYQFILWVPRQSNHVYRSRSLRCPYYNLWSLKA